MDNRKNNNKFSNFYLLFLTLKLSLLTICLLFIGCVGIDVLPLSAQQVDPIRIPNPIPLPEPTPPPVPPLLPPQLPPPEELLQPPTTAPKPQEEPPLGVPETIRVERFKFEGNTAFSEKELAEVTKAFVGKDLTFAELLQARSAVTKHYIDAGYITSGAFIPPQTLEGETVTIQVVEGELEGIEVKGTNRLRAEYVSSRLARAARKPLNVNRLLEALQVLQLNPLIKNLSAELSAGSRPGSSLLEVTISEADSFDIQLRADNGRTPSVGSFRRQVEVREDNLLGFGDAVSLAFTNTDGSNEWVFNYTVPFNSRNGTVNFSFSRTSSQIIEPPFDQVDIEAKSRNFEVSIRQPLIQTPTQELAVGLTGTRRESDTTLLNTPFPLSPGANELGQTRVTALRFFQEWTQRDSQQVFAARSQFSIGLGWRATVNDEPPDSRFFGWRGQVQWLRQLAPDTLLLLRGDMQLATRALLPLEQFGLGGLESVRGYRQDSVLSDNGVFASAELRLPIYRLPRQQGVLQVTPFLDFGTAWNSSGKEAPENNMLLSLGLGLRLQLGERFTARLDYGIPLIHVPSGDRTWQENGLYFSLVGSPFD
ncbi:MAG TPA: ShlB/FhaC/HecB family hemolysin secretion/activation protein [Oscillatoriaceae cyanobacterium M7585_C2015_266]|nr:ShlB/FhaC/HecB family hemolysin secretion/activation protein [Oscillatoriaceae cyanobacterium M7585_C2015_266]